MAKYVDVNKPVVELYSNGIGVCEIGKRLGVSRMKVLRTLKENNIVSEKSHNVFLCHLQRLS